MGKKKSEKFVSNWGEASYWVMMANEAIERRALLEAQEDVERLKERLEWVAKEITEEKNGKTTNRI